MELFTNIKDYISENNYKITITNNVINIVNYIEIKEFSSTKIIIKYKNGYTTIDGKSLVISKMLDNEILIMGSINSILLR